MAPRLPQERSDSVHWDPARYLTFADHRLRPALELLARVPLASPEVIYDLGCGAGRPTRVIAERWPGAAVYGVDRSRRMLGHARAEPSRIRWLETDVATWSPPEPVDLIYSNAALHWVPDHRELFPRLIGFLKPGGCLAAQMPLSWDLPSHRLMRETLADGALGGRALGTAELRAVVDREWVADTKVYFDLLTDRTRGLDVWRTEYWQILEGDDPVLEWVRGTGLRPILQGLDAVERETFLDEYARRLRTAYPPRDDGRTLYPFRRLFIVATV